MEIVRKTIVEDEEYLRQVSKEFDFSNNDFKEDIKLLEKFCQENECFALAAVQVGIPKKIIYLRLTNEEIDLDENPDYNEAKVLINPIVLSKKGHTKYWEACLSCLDNMGLVNRPYEMLIEYCDINGVSYQEKFEGFESTVLSHELDHLDGILHMDIAEKILVMSKEERKVFREEHPYEIISKDCEYNKEKKFGTI